MEDTRKVLLFMGPQGSGKGTQAQMYARRHGYTIVSTGDLFRKEAQKNSELGQAVHIAMSSGDLISDDLTVQVLKQYLETLPQGENLIFDGFPRTLNQATLLDNILDVTVAAYIVLTIDEAVKRISDRVQCPEGHTYNLTSSPPEFEGLCDFDGLTLSQREDDNEEAVRRRLALHEQTIPALLNHYRTQSKLVTVKGNASIDKVSEELTAALAPYVS